jgi:predicted dehydrogenase
MELRPLAVGILGCGHVSDQYLRGCSLFEGLRLEACADLEVERARRKADSYGIPKAYTPGELLADPEVELVVNLTPPLEHARASTEAIRSGKHVWSEKPLAATLDDGRRVLAAARECDVRVGCAPDTFLGGGLQAAARLVGEGCIGEPVAAVAFVSEHGYEHFHPAVDAFYGPGSGPALDLGPYYVTTLVAMLGPVKRVGGVARATFPERTIPTGPRRGERIAVHVPTHVSGVLEFESGVPANVLMSWDIWSTHLPYIEVYGSDGSVSLPNPDEYDGLPRLRAAGPEELRQPPPPPGSLPWETVPSAYGAHVERGIGVADMAHAIRAGRPHRASAELAYHVLEVLSALLVSSREGRHVEIESRCRRPAPLEPGDGQDRWLPPPAAGPACA